MSGLTKISMATMRGLLAAVALAALPAKTVWAQDDAKAALSVQVAQGELKGKPGADADRFLGIPYASPPVGARRWMPPAPPISWKGTRDAAQLGNKCPQNGWSGTPEYRNEDCLVLNIYRPHGGAAKKPVFMFIHGGAYTRGSAMDVDGGELARKTDAIVVTINYRLGVFGFLSTPELDKEMGGNSGNFAIMDQQAALRWVHANIAAFGGDPANVTLAGQSAGSMSVWVNLVSPPARGLFAKAMMISGAGNGEMLTSAEEQAHGSSANMAQRLGCGGQSNVLACMRSKSTDQVLKIGGFTPATPWHPVIDGKVLPASVNSLIKSGQAMKIPVISGQTSQEEGFSVVRRLAGGGKPWTDEDFKKFAADLPESARATYPLSNYPSPDDADIALVSDRSACGLVRMNRTTAAAGNPVYTYLFDDPAAPDTIFVIPYRPVGAYHTADLPYLFAAGYPYDLKPKLTLNTKQKALSDRMGNDLKGTLWTGVPGGSSAGRWAAGKVLRLNPDGDTLVAMDTFAAEHHCEVWDKAGKAD